MHITLPLRRHQQSGDRITKHALSGLQYYPALQHVCILGSSGRLLDPVEMGDSFGTFTVTAPTDCPETSCVATSCGTLQAFIGCHSALDPDDDNPDRWDSSKVCLSRTAPGHAAKMLHTDHDNQRTHPPKKRRLKDGKSMSLGEMLQGF